MRRSCPGPGLFMPVGTGATKNKGIFRRTLPVFDAAACTACMECALACPDNAIPNTGHELGDLLMAAIDATGLDERDRSALYNLAPAWADGIRRHLREHSGETDLAAVAALVVPELDEGRDEGASSGSHHAGSANIEAVLAALAVFPTSRTRPLFDAAEKAEGGTGVHVLRRRRPVEVHRLPAVHRGVRAEGAHLCGTVRRSAGHAGDPLRASDQAPGHPRARHGRRHGAGWRHQAHPAEPQRLLLDDRWPRRLPRLRRGHGHPPGQRAHPPHRRQPPARRTCAASTTSSQGSRRCCRRCRPTARAGNGSRLRWRSWSTGCTCTSPDPPATAPRRR